MLSSSRQPLQSIPFVAVVVAGVDRHDSALLSSFIGLRIVYGYCFLFIAIVRLSKKIVSVISRSPDEAHIGSVLVF
jgi:hypothetical protein